MGRSFKIHLSKDIKGIDIEIVFSNASRKWRFKETFNKNSNIPDVLALVEHKEYAIKMPGYSFYQSVRKFKNRRGKHI